MLICKMETYDTHLAAIKQHCSGKQGLPTRSLLYNWRVYLLTARMLHEFSLVACDLLSWYLEHTVDVPGFGNDANIERVTS